MGGACAMVPALPMPTDPLISSGETPAAIDLVASVWTGSRAIEIWVPKIPCPCPFCPIVCTETPEDPRYSE